MEVNTGRWCSSRAFSGRMKSVLGGEVRMALGAQRTPPHRPPISRFFDEIYLSLRQGSGYLRLLEQLNTDVNAKRFLGTLAQAAEQIQLQIVNNARPALAEVVVNDFNARFSPPPSP